MYQDSNDRVKVMIQRCNTVKRMPLSPCDAHGTRKAEGVRLEVACTRHKKFYCLRAPSITCPLHSYCIHHRAMEGTAEIAAPSAPSAPEAAPSTSRSWLHAKDLKAYLKLRKTFKINDRLTASLGGDVQLAPHLGIAPAGLLTFRVSAPHIVAFTLT